MTQKLIISRESFTCILETFSVLRNNYLLVDVGDLNSKEKLTCKCPRAIVIINTILVELSFVLKIDYT